MNKDQVKGEAKDIAGKIQEEAGKMIGVFVQLGAAAVLTTGVCLMLLLDARLQLTENNKQITAGIANHFFIGEIFDLLRSDAPHDTFSVPHQRFYHLTIACKTEFLQGI